MKLKCGFQHLESFINHVHCTSLIHLLFGTHCLLYFSTMSQSQLQVSALKDKLASQIGVPVEQQRLIFRGKVLKDNHLLSEYCILSTEDFKFPPHFVCSSSTLCWKYFFSLNLLVRVFCQMFVYVCLAPYISIEVISRISSFHISLSYLFCFKTDS